MGLLRRTRSNRLGFGGYVYTYLVEGKFVIYHVVIPTYLNRHCGT